MLGLLKRAIFYLSAHSRKSKISFFSKYLNSEHIVLGQRVSIGGGSVLFPIRDYAGTSFDAKIEIADDVYIGHQSQLHCIGSLHVGRGSVISDYVYISDVAHGLLPTGGLIMAQPLETKGPVHIGENCFIGYGVAVMPGVALGSGCVVAARAVVTKSFPPYSMLVGSPPRMVKTFDFEKDAWVAV